MADTFRKFVSGDKLRMPAELYNLMVDAVSDYMRNRKVVSAESSGKAAKTTRLGIRNISNSTLEQFAVVGIGAALVAPGGEDTSFYGDTYFESAAPASASPFAIVQDPAVDDGYAPAVADGVSFVRLSVSNTAHAYAAPSAGVYTHLVSQSAVGPATTLWKENGGTLLNGAINNSVTYITVDSGDAYPDVPFVVTIDSEDLNVTAVRGTTLLNGAIDDVTTTIVVDSAAGFPASGTFAIDIDSERMNVTAGAGTTTWTVTRGYQGSTADQHGDNSDVTATANTYWTVTRAYNSTSAASHSDNAPITMKSGVVWALVRIDSQGSGSSGVGSINDDTTAAQTIGLGTAGTDINITTTGAAYSAGVTYSRGMIVTSGGSTYRYSNATPSAGNAPPNATYWVDVTGDGLTIVNVPDASATVRGLVTTGTQELGGVKTFHEKAVFRGFTNNVTLDIDFQRAGGQYSVVSIDAGFTGQSEVHIGASHATDDSDGLLVVASWANLVSGAGTGAGQGGLVLQASALSSKPAWSSGVSYLDRGSYVLNGGDAYRCWENHTSNSTNEPGVGADWQLYWHKMETIGVTGHTAPVIVVNDDFGFWRQCRTGLFSGLEFVAGLFVGGSLDLTGVDGTTLSGLEIGTDVQAWSADLDAYAAAAPVSDIGALTDSTGGTANTTLVAISGTGDDANINDNFADLTAQVNALRAALQTLGAMS